MISDWLNRARLNQRILAIFATPLLIAILFIGYNVTVNHLANTRHALEDRGELLAKHLGVLSEFGMFSSDHSELEKYADSILEEADVVYVIIEDSHRSVQVNKRIIGYNVKPDDLIEFTCPISRSGVNVSDFETDLADDTDSEQIIGHVRVGLSKYSVYFEEKRILLTGIVATGSALLASFLLALLVARSVSDPIVRLTRVVKKLTDGRLSARSSEASHGELGSLEKGVNKMARTMQGAQSDLLREVRDATEALHDTVSELENKNREIEQARAVVLEADTAKSEFLAKMSHEIRTPLSAIIGFSRLLEKTGQSDDQQEYSSTINQAASQLLVIIDDILNFSRLESGTLSLEIISFDLHECLENVVSILSAQAHEKHLELVLYIHSDVPTRIHSDANRISQVLTNLVSNAIKFTNQGHVIVEVSLLDTPGQDVTLHISVTDTGIGLDESRATEVFDPFTQADASTNRIYGGTGLGLSISKKLIELLGGDIGLKSSLNKGACLWFTLPHLHMDPADNTRARPLAGMKVLVYDENSFTRRALRNRFLSWGATVFNTSDWRKMLSMVQSDSSDPYALLVAGLSTRQYSDSQVGDTLSVIRQTTERPVLALVGAETLHLRIEETGFLNIRIISKPPRSDRMLRTVQQLLAGNAALPPPAPSRIANTESGNSDMAGINVLVAEDNRFNQKLITRVLRDMGITVTIAVNGEEACKHASKTVYDMIFMDIHMPVMGGLEATTEIRKGINRQTPVIALTADVFAAKDHYFDEVGLNDCLFKPVRQDNLVEMLRKWQNLSSVHNPGKTGIPAELLPELQQEVAAQLKALRNDCTSGNQSGIQDHMHQLKGLIEYFHMTAMDSDFRQLQQAIANGAPGEIADRLNTLDATLEKFSNHPD